MKEFKEWIREMDTEEKKDAIGAAISWIGLAWLGFILSIIGG